jgi:alanine-alpha-ketoisovalerate/valine-pyruvate aminotransferase
LGFSEFEIKRYQMILDDFIESKRPPVEIRDKLDIAYRVDNQSVTIYEKGGITSASRRTRLLSWSLVRLESVHTI